MFLLGHVGIGTHMIPPRIRARLPWRWLVVGCLVPDLLDKPLFLGARLLRRLDPGYLELIGGSRLFGHTLLFSAVLIAAAAFTRSARLRAVAWAVPTHLALDLALDLATGHAQWRNWLLWPLFGRAFPLTGGGPLVRGIDLELAGYILGDIVGASLLAWDYARWRRARA